MVQSQIGYRISVYTDFIQCLAIKRIGGFFRTLAVIDTDVSFTAYLLQQKISEGFFTEIIERTARHVLFLYSGLQLTIQTELRRTLRRFVKVPTSGIHINSSRRIAGLTAFVNPLLVLVCYFPSGVGIYRFTFYI